MRSSDHPRSRGVYCSQSTPTARRTGSSPLARGLRQMLILFCAGDGIIPARAGFTYKELSLSDFCVGSSPLARGLLTAIVHPEERPRIIPARAGFTHRLPGPPRRGQDHPRSRGVYRRCGGSSPPGRGSSPLARGLPQTDALLRPARGIIPARAGFTERPGDRTRAVRDHPRSRGVYRGIRVGG